MLLGTVIDQKVNDGRSGRNQANHCIDLGDGLPWTAIGAASDPRDAIVVVRTVGRRVITIAAAGKAITTAAATATGNGRNGNMAWNDKSLRWQQPERQRRGRQT